MYLLDFELQHCSATKSYKLSSKPFVNRNANVVPLHRKNKAPARGRKISHVWPQKKMIASIATAIVTALGATSCMGA